MKAKKGYKGQKGKTSTGKWLKRYFNKRTSKKFKQENDMEEYKGKQPLGPHDSPNDATALKNTCVATGPFGICSSKLREEAHVEANQKMKESIEKEQAEGSSKLEPTTKEPTPQELQQKIHSENLRNQLNNSLQAAKKRNPCFKPLGAPKLVPEPTEIDPSIAAIVAAIESGAAFVILLDDGVQVTLHASKLSQPAILGLLVKFAHQLTTQEIVPKDQSNG